MLYFRSINRFILISLALLSLSVQSVAQGALVSRLGGLAYYDTELDISWLTDANFARTSGFDPNGQMTWDMASAWAAGLSVSGISGWRLPSHDVNGDEVIINCTGGGVLGCSDNEMGYLYYEEGITTFTPGPFLNLQNEDYWGSTEYLPSSQVDSWVFNFGQDGSQNQNFNTDFNFAWATHDGDVGNLAVVPVPAAAWLFGTALIGLIGVSKRKAKV
jgi:hypothetical protein